MVSVFSFCGFENEVCIGVSILFPLILEAGII